MRDLVIQHEAKPSAVLCLRLYLSAGSALTGLKHFFMIIHLENSCFQPPNNHCVSLWYKLVGKTVSLINKLICLFEKETNGFGAMHVKCILSCL